MRMTRMKNLIKRGRGYIRIYISPTRATRKRVLIADQIRKGVKIHVGHPDRRFLLLVIHIKSFILQKIFHQACF